MKRLLYITVACVMLLSLVSCGSTFEWPDTDIAATLPIPPSNAGKIGSNSNDHLSVTVEDAVLTDYNTYLDSCKERGYTIEPEVTGTQYDAYNKEGYALHLYYNEHREEIHITVSAPEEFGQLTWPTGGLAAMLPTVTSVVGDINWDKADSLNVDVGSMTYEEYQTYVAACEKKGFTVDFSKDKKSFSALNKDGYELSVYYRGFNSVEISLRAPENSNQATTTTTTAATITTTTKEEPSGVSADFKAMMDGYEAFMDKYVSFMLQYKNSNDAIGMMGEYADIMAEYSDYMSKVNAVDTKALSAADYAYYIDVTARIAKKLVSIQ